MSDAAPGVESSYAGTKAQVWRWKSNSRMVNWKHWVRSDGAWCWTLPGVWLCMGRFFCWHLALAKPPNIGPSWRRFHRRCLDLDCLGPFQPCTSTRYGSIVPLVCLRWLLSFDLTERHQKFSFWLFCEILWVPLKQIQGMLSLPMLNHRMLGAILGIETKIAMRAPLAQSTSIRDFWGRRWNLIIHNLMKRCFFVPFQNEGQGRRWDTRCQAQSRMILVLSPAKSIVGTCMFQNKDFRKHIRTPYSVVHRTNNLTACWLDGFLVRNTPVTQWK